MIARISRRPLAFALTDIPAPAEGQIACVCVCAAAVHASGQPGGIRAFMKPFKTYELDLDALARFDRPVYFALGGLSNPDQYAAIATRLGRVFQDFELEEFEERHHFDPPHRIEPERLAGSLRALWGRADRVEAAR